MQHMAPALINYFMDIEDADVYARGHRYALPSFFVCAWGGGGLSRYYTCTHTSSHASTAHVRNRNRGARPPRRECSCYESPRCRLRERIENNKTNNLPAANQVGTLPGSVPHALRVRRRSMVSAIMKNLWKSAPHREAVVQQSKTSPRFNKYLLLLINDAIDHLDQGREQLGHYIAAKAKVADAGFAALPQTEQDEARREVSQSKGHAKAVFGYAQETIETFTDLTTEFAGEFSDPALASRLAGLLNFNTKEMASNNPQLASLSELDFKDFGLDRQKFLSCMIRVYVQVAFDYTDAKGPNPGKVADAKASGFVRAVAMDGRSFDPAAFRRAAAQVERGVSPSLLGAFEQLVVLAEGVAKDEADQDVDLGEIPDEYLDPLLSTLMKDPVKLPSGNIVDRPTIEQHLIDHTFDPFNRQPMTKDQVEPCLELKKEIEGWVAQQMSQKR